MGRLLLSNHVGVCGMDVLVDLGCLELFWGLCVGSEVVILIIFHILIFLLFCVFRDVPRRRRG